MYFAFVLAPDRRVVGYDEEDNGEDEKNDKTNNRPFLHFRLNRLTFVLTEEGFTRSAEGVNPRRVAGL